jgi:hypothetical protein
MFELSLHRSRARARGRAAIEFGVRHGLYGFPTQELVDFLEDGTSLSTREREALEIA